MYSLTNLLKIFLFISSTHSLIFNSTPKDSHLCKIHLSRGELSYTKFFQITNSHRNASSSLVFDFHFGVQAPSDAHILLSPSSKIVTSDPVYEIVLGAGGNTFCDIRRFQKLGTKVSTKVKDILSFKEIRWFWLHISQDGFIEVGKEGEKLALLSWRDPDPLPIQVFSFSSWPGIEALWFFDCAREDNSSAPITEEVPHILTARQKLMKVLFEHYDPYVRPNTNIDDFVIIHSGLTYDRIVLDEMNSKLIIDGIMQLQWLDESILWDPKDFDNIESLSLMYREIWLPDLVVYNSASGPGTEFQKSINILINSQGWVTWITQVHIEVWCDASGLGHWPNDQHMCEIQLGFWTQESFLLLEASANASVIKKSYSEWEIISIEDGHDSLPTPWNVETDSYSNIFVMRYTLRRTSNVYTIIYFTPIIAITISLLVSFWLEPIGPYRISLYCFQLIILSAFLTKLGTSIPAHPTNIPYLVYLYAYLFIATLLGLIFTTIIINWNYQKHTKPISCCVYRFLSLNFMKSILCVNSEFSESYSKIADERGKSKEDIRGTWVLLGIAFDRVLFIIYLVLSIVFLSKNY